MLPLTKRENQILRCVLHGLCNKEIAFILKCSPKTVESHVCNIYQKLKVNERLSLARVALGCGLVSIRDFLDHKLIPL